MSRDCAGVLRQENALLNRQSRAYTLEISQDVLASATPAGAEWRAESFGVNPYATLPVEAIGVRFLEGTAVDYTVEVTDARGSFYVWARNLDRALELQWKTGDARAFNLRNYEVDFAALDEVGSADDSRYRVEKLTPAQFHFARITSITSPIFDLPSRKAKHSRGVVGKRKIQGSGTVRQALPALAANDNELRWKASLTA